ncbi:MAG: glycosyltransferase family 4 protein [Cyclobacteriaceae bacterium]|nr:glycosyltransferase family 4 protein [Cyclobacteriaceae bacterium]
MRVLYIVKNYPQLSQSYIKSEINCLIKDFQIEIIATSVPNTPDVECLPYQQISDEEKIIQHIERFKPDIIHGHYLLMAKVISSVSKKTNIPFTIRAHSFDALKNEMADDFPSHISQLHEFLNHDLCKGVLIFPFTRDLLIRIGKVNPNKLIDAPPVVNTKHFFDKTPNGNGIMNTGACIPKKSMETFVSLSKLLPNDTFNLYGLGHDINKIAALNKEIGGRVNFIEPTLYSQMPREYKKHRSLVYTANMQMKTVGWPMAVMEAMASGTMVYMPEVRPDIKDYIGDAGYVYKDVRDIVELLKAPVDMKKREMAFNYSLKFDISAQISKLTNLW